MKTASVLLMAVLSVCMPVLAADVHNALAAGSSGAHSCSGWEQRALDFWAGDWNVTNAARLRAGTSHIERALNGCVVMEHWTGARGGYAGKSFNTFDPATGEWTQHYVDNAGLSAWLVGRFEGPDLVYRSLPGDSGGAALTRMTFFNVAPGSVRQLIEQSANGGKTWGVASDLHYAAGSPNCSGASAAGQVERYVVVPGTSIVLTASDGQRFQWYEGASGDTSLPIAGDEYQLDYLPRRTGTQRVWVAAAHGCGTTISEFEIEVIVPLRMRSVRH